MGRQKFPRLLRIHLSLTLFLATEPLRGRVPIALASRLTAVALAPFEGCVIVGVFWRGELVLLIDRAVGQG